MGEQGVSACDDENRWYAGANLLGANLSRAYLTGAEKRGPKESV